MELDEFKNIWKEENKKLEDSIKMNEKLLKRMNMDKSIGEFDKMLKLLVLGRNLALVYCIISIWMATVVIEELAYSIPAIAGGMAMLWSFVSHLAIQKPDYQEISLIELQKSICKFRIHTSKHAKYDAFIASFWLLTLAPLHLRVFYKVFIYADLKYLSVFSLISFVAIVLVIALSRKAYQKYERKLRQSEADLEKIAAFEEL